jgi:hypothetical protein
MNRNIGESRMNEIIIWLIASGTLSILFGIILMTKSAPYNVVVSTLHKVISFALGVVFIILIYGRLKTIGFNAYPIILTILTMVIFIISVVSGSILISVDTIKSKMKLTHRITSILTFIFGIYTLVVINIL